MSFKVEFEKSAFLPVAAAAASRMFAPSIARFAARSIAPKIKTFAPKIFGGFSNQQIGRFHGRLARVGGNIGMAAPMFSGFSSQAGPQASGMLDGG